MAKKNKKRTRKDLSLEEKTLRTLQANFIFQALSIKMNGKDIRKILSVNMNEISPILKPIAKAIKKVKTDKPQ
jgi:hypothetical protein